MEICAKRRKRKRKRTTRALRENVAREESRNLGTLSEVRNQSTTIYHGACYYITTGGESTYFTGSYARTIIGRPVVRSFNESPVSRLLKKYVARISRKRRLVSSNANYSVRCKLVARLK